MATINCNDKRPFRIALVPYVTILASVLVLAVGPSGVEVFVFVEVFQSILQEVVNDTSDIVHFITQDVCAATSPTDRLAGKGQPM
jgi:hypothetical protein